MEYTNIHLYSTYIIDAMICELTCSLARGCACSSSLFACPPRASLLRTVAAERLKCASSSSSLRRAHHHRHHHPHHHRRCQCFAGPDGFIVPETVCVFFLLNIAPCDNSCALSLDSLAVILRIKTLQCIRARVPAS